MPLIRYFAAVRAAAGVAEEALEGNTLAELLDAARASRDQRFAVVLGLCSFLVDGAPVGTRDPGMVAVPEGSTLDCLPPFAGG